MMFEHNVATSSSIYKVMKPDHDTVNCKIPSLLTMTSYQSYLNFLCTLTFQCWQHLLTYYNPDRSQVIFRILIPG